MRVRLLTDRLVLDPLDDSDLGLYVALYTDAATLARAAPALEPARARRAFAAERRETGAASPRRLVWTMREAGGARFGLMGLALDEEAGGEVGVVLPPERQGCGFATEAIDALARFAFGPLALARLTTRHASDHPLAEGLMRRLGFVPETSQAGPHPCRWTLEAEAWRARRGDKHASLG